MKTKSRGWGSMTKAERKVEAARRRSVAESRKRPPTPAALNQMSTGVMEYSKDQHISDLESQLQSIRVSNRRIVEVSAECFKIILERVR